MPFTDDCHHLLDVANVINDSRSQSEIAMSFVAS